MKFSYGVALIWLALSSVEAFAVPPQHVWMKSLGVRAYRVNPVKRERDLVGGLQRREAQEQQQGGGGGLTIGGLTLGGPNGGISGNGLQLAGNRQGNPIGTAETQKTATVGTQPETGAGAGTENQPGRAEGEAAKQEAQQEAQTEESNGVKATEESERFSEESGITLDGSGNAQNLGGNLGITKGSDGSTSVGGENGINVAANGEARVAGKP